MAASPEAEVEFKPKYSAEDLRDPTKRTEALLDYDPVDIGVMGSDEVDEKLEQAMRDGLVRPKMSGGEVRGVDDTFAGKMELESTIPDVQAVLENLKNRKLQVVGEDTENGIKVDLGRLPGGSDRGVEMVNLFEQAYRRGDVTLVETAAAVPAKGKPGTVGYVSPVPAKYEWRPATRREAAIKQAFERVNATLDPGEQPKFADAPTEAGRHRGELDRQAKDQQAKAKAHYEQHQRRMADEARKKIEAADQLNDDQARDRERAQRVGENRVVLPAGTRVQNFDPIMQRDHYERTASGRRRLVRAQVDASGRLLREHNVVDQQVVNEALEEDRRRTLENQYGTGPQAVERARREASAENTARDIAALGPMDRVRHTMHEASIAGRSPAEIARIRDTAHEQAIAEARGGLDREVAAVSDVMDRYNDRINAETDANIRKQLIEARNAAADAEQERQKARTQEIGQIRAEAVNMVPEILTRAQDRERWVGETLHGYDENGAYVARAEERATERLRALGIENTVHPVTGRAIINGEPFLELNHGRVREAYYRAPNSENIVVFERYNRRNGEFISQTIMTTHEPLRRSRIGGHLMPPREIREAVTQARNEDENIRRVQERTGLRRAARAVLDYAGIAIDTGAGSRTGRIESDTGPYARRGMDQVRRQAMRGRAGRHGGFFYWFWNR